MHPWSAGLHPSIHLLPNLGGGLYGHALDNLSILGHHPPHVHTQGENGQYVQLNVSVSGLWEETRSHLSS